MSVGARGVRADPKLFPLDFQQQSATQVAASMEGVTVNISQKGETSFYSFVSTTSISGPQTAARKFSELFKSTTVKCTDPYLKLIAKMWSKRAGERDVAVRYDQRKRCPGGVEGEIDRIVITGTPMNVASFLQRMWDEHQKLSREFVTLSLTRNLQKLMEHNDPSVQVLQSLMGQDRAFACSQGLLVRRCDIARVQDALRPALAQGLSALRCNHCGGPATHTILQCGHKYCRDCFHALIREDAPVPMRCSVPNCEKRLLHRDFVHDPGAAEKIILRQIIPEKHRIACCRACHEGVLVARICDTDPLTACNHCGQRGCAFCEVSSDFHDNVSCKVAKEQDKQYRERPKLLVALVQNAKKFVKQSWIGISESITNVMENPFLSDLECPAVRSFMYGLRERRFEEAGVFGWHGSGKAEAIVNICWTNLDVHRRSGQVHGPGEYFAPSPTVSLAYSRGTGHMLTFFCFHGPQFSSHGNYCYVEDNPSNDVMFQLPLLIVSFGTSSVPLDFNVRRDPLDAPATPFRFRWEDDNGTFHVYPNEYSVKLEAAYHDGGGCILRGVVRCVDDEPTDYEVDFCSMTQTNARTGNKSRMDRVCILGSSFQYTFQYLDGGQWSNYDPADQSKMNKEFELYRQGKTSGVFSLHPVGRGEEYSIDFRQSCQVNKESKAKKAIRRN